MKKKLSKWSKKLEQLVVYNTNGPMVLSRKKPIQSWQQVKNVIANKVRKLKIQLNRKDHLESEKNTNKKKTLLRSMCMRQKTFIPIPCFLISYQLPIYGKTLVLD